MQPHSHTALGLLGATLTLVVFACLAFFVTSQGLGDWLNADWLVVAGLLLAAAWLVAGQTT